MQYGTSPQPPMQPMQTPQPMQHPPPMHILQAAGPQPIVEPEQFRNLMVNYIPTTVDELQLRQLFEQFGAIESVKIVCDRETHQSRGYGFVKYHSAASAQQAIQSLNGYNIHTKRLKVALAANGQQQRRTGMGRGNGNFGGYMTGYPSAAVSSPYGMNPYAPPPPPMMPYPQQYMMPHPQ